MSLGDSESKSIKARGSETEEGLNTIEAKSQQQE